MKPQVMKEAYSRFKDAVRDGLDELRRLCEDASQPGLAEAARGLVRSVDAPFLFVIVGEVKSGKSSLINALLQDDICRVAPDPCTDTIQKIVHSPSRYEKELSQYVREIGSPSAILEEVAIVDTPGTNTIIDQHQEITETFLPEADLVMFVFPAQNPYTQSSWDFFSFVSEEWRKKIVFVLQQVDRVTDKELEVNASRVAEYARLRGMGAPRLFLVSAKKSRQDPEAGGVGELWRYIHDTVTGGRHYLLKMESVISTAETVLNSLESALDAFGCELDSDKAEEKAIREFLAQARERAAADVADLRTRLVETYAHLSGQTCREFEEGLAVANLARNSLAGVLGRKNSLKEWLAGLHMRFNQCFAKQAESISREAAARMSLNLASGVEILLGRLRQTARRDARSIGPESLAEQRLHVADEVLAKVFALLELEALNERLQPDRIKKIGDQTMAGGFLTALGAIIAASAHVVVFDVTGGVFSTLGALLAINTLVFRRRGIVRAFAKGFDQGRVRLEEELSAKLDSRLEDIFLELEQAFTPFFENIARREQRLAALRAEAVRLRRDLRRELEAAERTVEGSAGPGRVWQD